MDELYSLACVEPPAPPRINNDDAPNPTAATPNPTVKTPTVTASAAEAEAAAALPAIAAMTASPMVEKIPAGLSKISTTSPFLRICHGLSGFPFK